MSWETIYTVEWDEYDQASSVINETSITGHTVISGLSNHEAKLAAEAMNEVYNQIKKDIESGRLKEKK
jgi:hypothetical protein